MFQTWRSLATIEAVQVTADNIEDLARALDLTVCTCWHPRQPGRDPVRTLAVGTDRASIGDYLVRDNGDLSVRYSCAVETGYELLEPTGAGVGGLFTSRNTAA